MPEHPSPYNLEQAQEEAEKIKAKVESGEAEGYAEAEKMVDFEKELDNLDYKNFDFNKLSEIPAKFHKKLAIKLIEAGEGFNVTNNIEKFQGLDQEVVLKFIEAGQVIIFVADNIEKFQNINYKEIALKLIEAGEGFNVTNNIEKFQGLDKEVALKFIEAGNGLSVIIYIEKFQGLDQEVVLKLIEAGAGAGVADNIEKFQNINHQEVIIKLIEAGEGASVADNIEKFQNINYKEIALKLIEAGKGLNVIICAEKFQGLDQEIIIKLIEAGEGSRVIRHIEKFQNINYKEMALKFIEIGQGSKVIRDIEKFQGLDKEVALKLIEAGEGSSVIRHIGKFQGLDQEVIIKLIEAGEGARVIRHIEKFQNINYKEIVLKLIEAGEGFNVANNIEKFQGLDQEVALKLIEAGEGLRVIIYIEKFQGLDQEVALKFIETDLGSSVAANIEKFQNISHKEIILKLIEAGERYSVANNIEKFQGLDQEAAIKIIEAGEGYIVADNLEKFRGLDAKEVKKYSEENNIKVDEAVYCICKNADKKLDKTESKGFAIYEMLKNNHPDWKDKENIIKPFEAGAEIFGYEKMFAYLNRPELSRHDGLHNFLQIIKSYESSGLKPAQYFNNILAQVARDDAEYYEGTAHHRLNSLVDNINYDFEGTIQEAKQYSDIKKLRDLMSELDGVYKIFSSWKKLKKYQEVCKLLGRTEILDQLKILEKEGKEKLYEYIETLAFHPNISMEEVFRFWKDPESFLNNADSHTPEETHDRKKPSNYIEIPNLDLTAEDLRDALVEGSYDKLQAFSPLEINYQISSGERMSLRKELAKQIGVRDGNLRKKLGLGEKEGLKSNPKLFTKLNRIFKASGYDLKRYLSGEEEIDRSFADELEQFRMNRHIEEYRVKINRKSDPDGVVAGNDTACCMPFGSGKNNVYTFNPVCALLTVQRKNVDGTYRTIAQSVLTLDKDIKENVADLIGRLDSADAKLHEVIKEDALIDKPSVITCDNVEVAKNYKSHPRAGKILEDIYRDFFREYLNHFSAEEKLDKSRVIIGQGYSDSLTHLPRVNNTFVPEAPVGYSDNLHKESYLLDLIKQEKETLIAKKEIVFADKERREAKSRQSWPKGVSYLTYRDTLAVAYIEGKAYHDNENLIQYLHNMENALIAKDVNNKAKGRANMSFKYKGSDNKTHGYLLAYEGVADSDSEIQGERVLYVADLASDGNKRAGGSLILVFVQEYKRNYLDKGDLIPIYMQLREKTSYPIIVNQLEKLSENAGYKFYLEELGTYEEGDDTMYETIIRVKK